MCVFYSDIKHSSDQELLELVVRESQAASDLLKMVDSLPDLIAITSQELENLRGIGPKRALQIIATLELARRIYTTPGQKKLDIKSPDDVSTLMMSQMRYYDREHFRVLYLDRKGGLISMEDVSVGGLHNSLVHPREVFKTAVKRSAASIILVHNHPSGDPSPSQEDIGVTKRLVEAGHLMGIEVLDHVIIGDGRFCSLKSQNLM